MSAGLTTIERLENAEKTIAEFSKGLELIVSLTGQITQLEQNLNHAGQMIGGLEDALKSAGNMIMTLVDTDGDTNHSIAALAKTVGAMAEILESKGILTGQDLQKKKQESEDREERRLVETLIEMGSIEKSATPVTPDSLVILTRTELSTSKPNDSFLMSEFLMVDLSSPVTTPDLKQDLIGKNIGETVSYAKDKNAGLFTVLTVKEVYAHKKVESLGENENNNQA